MMRLPRIMTVRTFGGVKWAVSGVREGTHGSMCGMSGPFPNITRQLAFSTNISSGHRWVLSCPRRVLPGRSRRVLQGWRSSLSSVAMTNTTNTASDIPGPKSYPVIGSLPDILGDKDFDKNRIDKYFQKLLREYGPIVKVQFPGQPTLILLSNPEHMKMVFRLTESNPVRNGLQGLKKARYLMPYYEKKAGLAAEDGEEWWRCRSQVQATVLRLDSIRFYLKGMDQVTLDLLDRISRERTETGEVTVDLMDLLGRWSLESVCLISLNQRLGSLGDESSEVSSQFFKAAQTLMSTVVQCELNPLWKFYPTKPFKDLQTSLKVLTELCDKVLTDYEKEINVKNVYDPERKQNLLERLLQNPKLTRRDVVTFMLDLLPGGTDTTSTNAIVAMYLLAKHPHVQARVREELDSVLGSHTGPFTSNQFAQLSYVKAVYRECNRLMPTTMGTNRLLQEDIEVAGYTLKKGWNCIMASGISGWDERQFPHSKEFCPERWLRHRPLGPIHPYASLPFSHGMRMCIGRRIAEQMLYLIIARAVQRFDIGWKNGELKRSHSIFYVPEEPFAFTFTDRTV